MPSITGFMGRGGVTTAAVVAALVGAAVSAATLTLTGAITLGESSAPTRAADTCYAWAQNNETLVMACGSDTSTKLTYDSGEDLSLSSGGFVVFDGQSGNDKIGMNGSTLSMFAGGVEVAAANSSTFGVKQTLSVQEPLVLLGESTCGYSGNKTVADTWGPVASCDATNTYNLTLPTASAGRTVIYVNDDGAAASFNTTIIPNTGDAIPECATSLVATSDYASATLWAVDATNWLVLNSRGMTCTP